MSLAISLVSKDKTRNTDHLEQELPAEYNELFGFESFRKKLWGHPIIEKLGCEIVHSLHSYDIYVFDKEVLQLKKELYTILDNLDIIENATGIDTTTIKFRVRNALAYIRLAEKDNDNLGINIG